MWINAGFGPNFIFFGGGLQFVAKYSELGAAQPRWAPMAMPPFGQLS
jgi:hypothetical protein